MQLAKTQIIALLSNAGEPDRADRAQRELPDPVDPERDATLLDELGVDVGDLLGGAAAGGPAGKLGL